MAIKTYQAGDLICKTDDPIKTLLFVTKGDASTEVFGEDFIFSQHDVIGLTSLKAGVYTSNVIAETEVSIFHYPFNSIEDINNLLQNKNPDLSYSVLTTTVNQVSKFLKQREDLSSITETAYDVLQRLYERYQALCKQYAFSTKLLPGALKISSPSEGDLVSNFLYPYYLAISSMEGAIRKSFFHGKPDISLGFFNKCVDDIANTIESCDFHKQYLKQVSAELFNSDTVNLFGLLSDLHIGAYRLKGADELIAPLVDELVSVIHMIPEIDQERFSQRYNIYKDKLANSELATQELTESLGEGVAANLADSMDLILTYSDCDVETTNTFAKLIYKLTDHPDPNSSDDEAMQLRKETTALFYEIYNGCFMKSLTDPAVPTVIKMFLNFGYIDPRLAGAGNADFLYSIADSYNGDKEKNVYTIYEWLKAIYHGEKEPSRNESDLDWPDHLRDLRLQRRITEEQEKALLTNQDEKIKFELENVLPVVNKITFGRISTYCPVFAHYNVLRDLNTSLVTSTRLYEAIDEVRAVDFSAFYRQRLLLDKQVQNYKINVNLEVVPEIILTPNVGNRGIMWQERSGRNNSTPARMFISSFYLEDLNLLIKLLTGELRWELTKRIQGTRWSDISDPSLTSEYFDYLQFYRSSKELTKLMKEDIKTELTRSRNTYKLVFARNYVDWIVHEANGSQRLNKVARRILIKYVPFRSDLREKLLSNPQYADPIKMYNNNQENRIKQLEISMQKMNRDKVDIPQEVLDEIEFAKI